MLPSGVEPSILLSQPTALGFLYDRGSDQSDTMVLVAYEDDVLHFDVKSVCYMNGSHAHRLHTITDRALRRPAAAATPPYGSSARCATSASDLFSHHDLDFACAFLGTTCESDMMYLKILGCGVV